MELPREDHEEGMRGKLGKATDVTRDAAQNWELEYTEKMAEAEFKQGEHSACVFYHGERNIRAVVHGDDFALLGRSKIWDCLRNAIEKRIEVKLKERLSREREGAARVLSRVVNSIT